VRILSVGNRSAPWSTGGYETIWAAGVAALRGAGHPTLVLTTLPDPSDRPAVAEPDVEIRRQLAWYWRAHAFPHRSLRQCVALERGNARTLAAAIGAWRPDAVMWWAMGGMSLSLLEQVRRVGLPAVGVVADDWPAYGPGVDGWIRRWRSPAARPAARVAERIVGVPARVDLDGAARWTFISAHVLGGARAAGWRMAHAAVHHPGVNPDRFAPTAAGAWRWRLLYCGRIDRRKGIATAVRALALLPGEATLTIDGDGDPAHAAELRALAAQLGIGDRIRFVVSEPAQIPAAYAACDALVFPVTWEEPWGLVPLEAMAVGRPVVASRAGGGPAEYLEPERNCLQFAPDDAQGLAAAIRRLAADSELRVAVVRGGAATAGRLSEVAFHRALESELAAAVAEGPWA
jgi:glycogen(starch) synthase